MDGDLPLRHRAASPAAPVITVHVQRRPAWGDRDLDPARTLHVADPANPDPTILDVGWTADGEGLRIRYAEGATFWIAASLDEVWLTYDAPLLAADAAHFLLEPVLAFVLRRRGSLVLHASAVEIAGRAVAFCGSTGAGKSSAAAACIAAGAALLTDDVLTLTLASGLWVAQRGSDDLRLWDAGALAFMPDLGGVPLYSPTWRKRRLSPSLLGGRDAAGPAPLALVCVLAARDPAVESVTVDPLRGQAAFGAVLPHTAANFLHDNERRAQEVEELGRLVNAVPVALVKAPGDRGCVAELPDAVAQHLGG